MDRDLVSVAGADPDTPAARSPADVVREERRPEATDEPRPASTGDVDDRNLFGLGSESRPQCSPARVDRDVPRERTHAGTSQDSTAQDDERHDLAAPSVADVGDTSVGMPGGVARLAETAQDVLHLECGAADEPDGADLRVSDHGHRADRLDAARLGKSADVAVHPATRKLDGDEPGLFVCGHEHELAASEPRE